MPLVSLEGLDRCGKSTLVVGLREALAGMKPAPLFLREPGGTALGEQVRNLILSGGDDVGIGATAELCLFNAARAQLLEEQVRPALAAGRLVVLDRFTDSSIAYQGHGRQLGADVVRAACDAATAGLRPDLTLLLVVSAAERARRRGEADRIEQAGDAFYARVSEGFDAIAAAEPQRVVRIDAEQLPAAVCAAALSELAARGLTGS